MAAGLLLSIVIFLVQLPSLLMSFAPSFWSALPFFILALAGAVSVVASYLGVLYAAGAGVAYTVITLTVQRRQQLEGRAYDPRRLMYGERHHWE